MFLIIGLKGLPALSGTISLCPLSQVTDIIFVNLRNISYFFITVNFWLTVGWPIFITPSSYQLHHVLVIRSLQVAPHLVQSDRKRLLMVLIASKTENALKAFSGWWEKHRTRCLSICLLISALLMWLLGK